MSVRKAIAGSVSYKDLIGAGLVKYFGERVLTGILSGKSKKLQHISLPIIVEPELIPTEKTKEMVMPLVFADENGGGKK